jgi:hypothetical protein
MSLAGRLFQKSEHFAVQVEQLDVGDADGAPLRDRHFLTQPGYRARIGPR